jgi:spore maturation protein CgeB
LKITIFGLTLSSSWGNGHATPYRALLRALHRRGHRITFFEKDLPYYASRRDFTASECDFCRLELYSDWESVRARALAVARESDVVITASYCPEGARINDEILALTGPLRVFYDLDTPLTLAGLARSGARVDSEYLRADQMPAFDLYLSFTGGRILPELEEGWGVRRAQPLYGCVDPDLHFRVAPREQFACDLSYMGTYAADRQPKLDALFLEPARRSPAARFVLAGALYPWDPRSWDTGSSNPWDTGSSNPWDTGSSNPKTCPENVLRFDHVAPADHAAFFSSSRLTLNITRAEMASWGYCPSGRFFEAAACGVPLISDDWEGLQSFFSAGSEIFLAQESKDILSVLRVSKEELREMAERARERTLDEHTGSHRAEELLGYIEESGRPSPTQRNASSLAVSS